MTNGKIPVDKVGGPKDRGPWPSDVEEIVEGKEYRRPVRTSNGILEERPVTVKFIEDFAESGDVDHNARVVRFEHGGQS